MEGGGGNLPAASRVSSITAGLERIWRLARMGEVNFTVVRRTQPVRTCVGCRQRAAKTDLLRVVAVGGSCVPDPRGLLPGRGASLHPVPACLDLAVRRRAFPRAFRLPGPLDTSPVRAFIEAQVQVSTPDQLQGTDRTVESGSRSTLR